MLLKRRFLFTFNHCCFKVIHKLVSSSKSKNWAQNLKKNCQTDFSRALSASDRLAKPLGDILEF
jgi:hypothetical protein